MSAKEKTLIICLIIEGNAHFGGRGGGRERRAEILLFVQKSSKLE